MEAWLDLFCSITLNHADIWQIHLVMHKSEPVKPVKPVTKAIMKRDEPVLNPLLGDSDEWERCTIMQLNQRMYKSALKQKLQGPLLARMSIPGINQIHKGI